jgi:plasmid stabilization system protein ParE
MTRPDERVRPARPSKPSVVPRRYRVDVTRAAERDIAAIHAHIGRDNLAAAASWRDRIERNIASLERWP